MPEHTDAELIRETLSGNQQSFAQLVRRYERRVAVTIRSVVGEVSQQDLADIAQDVFLLVFRGLPSFRGDAQFSTWLTQITLRHCYRESKRRRKKRSIFSYFEVRSDESEAPEARIPGTAKTDAAVMAGERHSEVIAALKELPEEFRTVLVLRVVEEMSVEEVAESLGISTGTVKSRLYRAKEKMRELLGESELEFQYNLE